ncbi:hypothetical protein BEL05_04975 [Shewanella colwelliana]|uniref:Uncharacterized protein n=1 Tax=Shewanella colwelliana TaxID=23 RepID=A0A1E5IP56_SHECO|nr:hypothetical protein [Shewanella colwelliana]OEG72332.1 hypothetical protein BEL05_04975 [Shewanella colwelliana]
MKIRYIFMILLSAVGVAACQTTPTDKELSKISYANLSPQVVKLSESTTKCALAMLVLNTESYSSIDEVYFNNGDTYGELMSALDDEAKQKLIQSVGLSANKYAALHYEGAIFPVMLEYVFEGGCNHLYFSDGFRSKYSGVIESLENL